MPLRPSVYAKMLGERIRTHGASVWLINTGWTGGPHGVGDRIPLSLTRRMVEAAVSDELESVDTRIDPVFGFEVPLQVAGVPEAVLDPRSGWSSGEDYDARATELAEMFVVNFEQFAADAGSEIEAAGPVVEHSRR